MPRHLLVSALAFLALSACKIGGNHEANVDCTGTKAGFQCAVQHKAGSNPIEVCWTVKVVCANGTVATGDACHTVEPGATSSKLLPIADIKNADKCDKAATTTVENLKLTKK